MNKETYIELDNVSKEYKNVKAVNGLSLKVNKGDIYGLLGPNGAGKSTSIRMILSLIKPTTGKIKLFGHDLSQERYKTLSRIGSLIEKPDFYNYLPARKNLELLGKFSGLDNLNNRIDEVLDLVGLTDRQQSKVKTYSQGMKQRLGIAQALLHDPDLIILDEPANGLDPQGQKEMRELIRSINQDKGITVVISSHILAEVEQIATRMVIINRGKNVVEGRVDELLTGKEMKISLQTDNNEQAARVLKDSDWKEHITQIEGDKLYLWIRRKDIPELNRFLTARGLDIYSIEKLRTLEEFFLSMTEND